MRLALVGSRQFPDEQLVRNWVQALPKGTVVVSGGCPDSPDAWAEDEARKLGLEVKIWPADWNKHGKAAGMIRNKDVVADSDRVDAFWDGESKGTASTIRLAREAGKLGCTYVVRR